MTSNGRHVEHMLRHRVRSFQHPELDRPTSMRVQLRAPTLTTGNRSRATPDAVFDSISWHVFAEPVALETAYRTSARSITPPEAVLNHAQIDGIHADFPEQHNRVPDRGAVAHRSGCASTTNTELRPTIPGSIGACPTPSTWPWTSLNAIIDFLFLRQGQARSAIQRRSTEYHAWAIPRANEMRQLPPKATKTSVKELEDELAEARATAGGSRHPSPAANSRSMTTPAEFEGAATRAPVRDLYAQSPCSPLQALDLDVKIVSSSPTFAMATNRWSTGSFIWAHCRSGSRLAPRSDRRMDATQLVPLRSQGAEGAPSATISSPDRGRSSSVTDGHTRHRPGSAREQCDLRAGLLDPARRGSMTLRPRRLIAPTSVMGNGIESADLPAIRVNTSPSGRRTTWGNDGLPLAQAKSAIDQSQSRRAGTQPLRPRSASSRRHLTRGEAQCPWLPSPIVVHHDRGRRSPHDRMRRGRNIGCDRGPHSGQHGDVRDDRPADHWQRMQHDQRVSQAQHSFRSRDASASARPGRFWSGLRPTMTTTSATVGPAGCAAARQYGGNLPLNSLRRRTGTASIAHRANLAHPFQVLQRLAWGG